MDPGLARDSRALTTSQEHSKEEIPHPGAALEREQQGRAMKRGQDRGSSSAHATDADPAGRARAMPRVAVVSLWIPSVVRHRRVNPDGSLSRFWDVAPARDAVAHPARGWWSSSGPAALPPCPELPAEHQGSEIPSPYPARTCSSNAAGSAGWVYISARPTPSSICADGVGRPELGLPGTRNRFPSFSCPKPTSFPTAVSTNTPSIISLIPGHEAVSIPV